MSIPSPRGLISRDSCLQSATRNSLGTTGHVFEDLLALDEPSSALFGNSKNLASASCGSVPFGCTKNCGASSCLGREHQNRAIPTPLFFARKFSTSNLLSHAEGTYHQSCMIELPRNHISELHVDKFPDTSGFHCWKTNFKTEVCSCSGFPSHSAPKKPLNKGQRLIWPLLSSYIHPVNKAHNWVIQEMLLGTRFGGSANMATDPEWRRKSTVCRWSMSINDNTRSTSNTCLCGKVSMMPRRCTMIKVHE